MGTHHLTINNNTPLYANFTPTDWTPWLWVRFPALNSFLGLERRFDHQKNGLDVVEATMALACARDSREQARNSEQRRTTSNRCSSAVIGRRKLISRVIGWKSLWGCGLPSGEKKIWNASRICVSSLRRGHANLLCIVPILVYVDCSTNYPTSLDAFYTSSAC